MAIPWIDATILDILEDLEKTVESKEWEAWPMSEPYRTNKFMGQLIHIHRDPITGVEICHTYELFKGEMTKHRHAHRTEVENGRSKS